MVMGHFLFSRVDGFYAFISTKTLTFPIRWGNDSSCRFELYWWDEVFKCFTNMKGPQHGLKKTSISSKNLFWWGFSTFTFHVVCRDHNSCGSNFRLNPSLASSRKQQNSTYVQQVRYGTQSRIFLKKWWTTWIWTTRFLTNPHLASASVLCRPLYTNEWPQNCRRIIDANAWS